MTDTPTANSGAPVMPTQRLRIVFGKLGSQKYVGHLDLAKTWERILRRAELTLSYSNGFNARPRMQMATALPLGITSECELLDIWLDHALPLEGLAERLTAVSPPGLPIYQISEVSLKAAPLQTLVDSTEYIFTMRTPLDAEGIAALHQQVEALMAQPRLMRTRRDKPYDLRPLINSMTVDEGGKIHIGLSLSAAGTGRPDEVLDALGLAVIDVDIHRIKITMLRG